MFAPSPPKDDGWFVIPGKLSDGSEVDLFTGGGPISYEKPRLVSATYKSQRWRRYLGFLWHSDHQDKRVYYGRWLCHEWNEQHPGEKRLSNFILFYMREDTLPPGQGTAKPVPVPLWEHQCFAEKSG